MFMGRVNGINLYKHGITRTYLNLDDEGNCYAYQGGSQYRPTDFSVELQKLEASLKKQGETLTTPYDDQYIARKAHTLHNAGFSIVRIRVEPEEFTMN
jgi:hypothetical protein